MENTLYYTFSTISQTLAGAIGLLAAFLIYYLDRLDRRIRGHLEVLYNRYPSATETVDLDFMWQQDDVPALLAYFERDPLYLLEGGEGLDKPMHLEPAAKQWQARVAAVSTARKALGWTTAAILFALLALASTQFLAFYRSLTVVSLSIGVALAAWCLYLYSQLVLRVAST